MKRFIIIAMLTAIMPLAAMAQHEEDTENGVVSLAGREGFTIETKKGDFVFKPYLLVQTSANFNWYDDEGLDKALAVPDSEIRLFGKPEAFVNRRMGVALASAESVDEARHKAVKVASLVVVKPVL